MKYRLTYTFEDKEPIKSCHECPMMIEMKDIYGMDTEECPFEPDDFYEFNLPKDSRPSWCPLETVEEAPPMQVDAQGSMQFGPSDGSAVSHVICSRAKKTLSHSNQEDNQ